MFSKPEKNPVLKVLFNTRFVYLKLYLNCPFLTQNVDRWSDCWAPRQREFRPLLKIKMAFVTAGPALNLCWVKEYCWVLVSVLPLGCTLFSTPPCCTDTHGSTGRDNFFGTFDYFQGHPSAKGAPHQLLVLFGVCFMNNFKLLVSHIRC